MSKKTWITEGFEAFRRGTFGNGKCRVVLFGVIFDFDGVGQLAAGFGAAVEAAGDGSVNDHFGVLHPGLGHFRDFAALHGCRLQRPQKAEAIVFVKPALVVCSYKLILHFVTVDVACVFHGVFAGPHVYLVTAGVDNVVFAVTQYIAAVEHGVTLQFFSDGHNDVTGLQAAHEPVDMRLPLVFAIVFGIKMHDHHILRSRAVEGFCHAVV